MTGTQAANKIISSIERIIDALEGNGRAPRRLELSQLLIDFDIDSPALLPEHKEFLDAQVASLVMSPSSTIIAIIGRASQTGPEDNNESLAFDRAQTTRAYLTAAGLADSRIGPVVDGGSRMPLIDIPGREAAVNRSVELLVDWEEEVVKQDPPPSGNGSKTWRLDLSATLGAGKIIGGKVQLGALHKIVSGVSQGSRQVSAWMVGLDLGVGIPGSFTADASIPGSANGALNFDQAVDYDWFDGRMFDMASGGGGAVVGGGSLALMNLWVSSYGQKAVSTSYTSYPIGLIFSAGGSYMVGYLNVANV